MKVLALMVCLEIFIAGCGSASSANTVTTANSVQMQSGQWEYVITPDNGSSYPYTMLLDANVPGTNVQFAATNGLIFQPSHDLNPKVLPIWCSAYNLDATIKANTIKADISWGDPAAHFADFSGELAANGQSISSGTYSGGVCSVTSGPGFGGPQIKGTVTGYTIAPVNGTYSGTLTNSLYGPDVVTFTIAQNPDFSLNASGTSVVNGVSTVLVGNPLMLSSIVTGATVSVSGSTQNVNGPNSFSFSGHLNPTATQLTVTLMNLGSTETLTGALTKQ
jgi:hypothetical protein